MEKKIFNEPEINITPVSDEDIIRTSEGITLPDDWWS